MLKHSYTCKLLRDVKCHRILTQGKTNKSSTIRLTILTMIVRGEPYMIILTAKHIAPTIDLRALRLCAPNNAPTANAMNATITASVKIMTFFCNTINN